jgi:hypothetical protein
VIRRVAFILPSCIVLLHYKATPAYIYKLGVYCEYKNNTSYDRRRMFCGLQRFGGRDGGRTQRSGERARRGAEIRRHPPNAGHSPTGSAGVTAEDLEV